jgi:imidazolonepropionase-like amidohydrolase
VLLLLCLALTLALSPSPVPTGEGRGEGSPTLLITNVTIVSTTDGSLRPNMTVVIEGGRITDVTQTPDTHSRPPTSTRVLDGTGKFVIPGLWDMHVHTFFGDWVPGGREVTLPLLLANGVTGARDMGSDLEPILAARRDVERGAVPGPRLVVSGPMLDGPKSPFPAAIAVATPEDGRRAVAMLADRGVDFIKIQSLVPRDAYFAIAQECRRRKIPFVGHVPDAVRASEAAEAGQKSFEHLIGIFEGGSTAKAEDAFVSGGAKGPGRFLATYDAAREAALIRRLAARRVWQCPTLFWERGQWLVDAIDPPKDYEADLTFAPASWREKSWPKFKAGILKDLDTDPLPVREKFVRHELEIVARLHRAGVPFLAGTDTPAGVGVVPGFSLHRELERFVAAGFTRLEALQTATVNPAKFLDRLSDLGTVEKGKLADLVLLDANPLEDIRNTRRIAAVVANGRGYSREDLDHLLSGILSLSR